MISSASTRRGSDGVRSWTINVPRPMTAVIILLISCANPPASLPEAWSRSARSKCSSMRFRSSASATLRQTPTTRPASSTTGTWLVSYQCAAPSASWTHHSRMVGRLRRASSKQLPHCSSSPAGASSPSWQPSMRRPPPVRVAHCTAVRLNALTVPSGSASTNAWGLLLKMALRFASERRRAPRPSASPLAPFPAPVPHEWPGPAGPGCS